MLAKKNRLTKQKDIELVYKKGKTLANRYFRLKYRANQLSHSRATVVVSQKVSKSAVKRNTLKRVARPLLVKALVKVPTGLDILLSVQPNSVKLTKEDYKKQLTILLSKI